MRCNAVRMKVVLDVDYLWKLLGDWGLSPAELSANSGVPPGTVSKHLKGIHTLVDVSIVQAYASALGAPWQALTVAERGWSLADTACKEAAREPFRGLNERSAISCSRSLDTYLIPDAMVEYVKGEKFRRLGVTGDAAKARMEWARESHALRVAKRERGAHVHRIICPGTLIGEAGRRERGWVDAIADNVARYREVSALGVVEGKLWDGFRHAVGQWAIFLDWDHIYVVDEHAAFVWSGLYMAYTYDREKVDLLRKAIDRAALQFIHHDFPMRDETSSSKLRSCSDDVADALRPRRK